MSAPYNPPPSGPQQSGPGGWGGPQSGGQPGSPPKQRSSLGLDKLLSLGIAAAGLLALFLGGLLSAFTSGLGSNRQGVPMLAVLGWANVLLVIAGLLALAVLLPKTPDSMVVVAAISLGTILGLLFASFGRDDAHGSVILGYGFWIPLVLAFLMAAAAVAAYLLQAGILKMSPKPKAQQYPPYGYGSGYGPSGYQPPGQPPSQPPTGYQQQPGAPAGYQGQPQSGYQGQPTPGYQGQPPSGYQQGGYQQPPSGYSPEGQGSPPGSSGYGPPPQ